MTGQEVNLLMPGNQMSWWPRHGLESWVQRGNNNVIEPTRELELKLDVTPESNGTSTSEDKNQLILNLPYNTRIAYACTCFHWPLAIRNSNGDTKRANGAASKQASKALVS
ncbi:hypothetical protein ANTPLA_LOCUS737 [Anthophora plagiata]